METLNLEELNQRYALPGLLRFAPGPGGLPTVHISDPHAQGMLVLQGAHVLQFQPRGQQPVLWASQHSFYAPGRPIRGGIPLCWPWFGAHPTDATKPGHGFARTSAWEVLGTSAGPTGTSIELGLLPTPATLALWPHPFSLRLRVLFGAQLEVELHVHNPGDQAFTFSAALHSYFAVSQVSAITITGLEESPYFDKVGGAPLRQEGPVQISAETDRVYQDTTAECHIEDPGLGRRICVAKQGSRSTVVWNPWAAKATRMEDFGDEEYRQMVCVETANAPPDQVTVPPGSAHCLQALIRVEPI
ncbi:MAG: D-hexose-6-phosphate mutarotase [Candidatus Latescibacteria bacterium]|nr:D-hexose-6-phosphate mutarotase [Candidatus Latescibacterota bacterium]